MPDVFDQLASAQQGSSQTPSPQAPSQTQPQSPASSAQTGTKGSQGDVFDHLASGVPDAPDAAPSSSTSGAPVPSSLHVDQGDNPALKLAKGVNAVGAGIGDGLLHTLNGGADMLHLPHATLRSRQNELEQANGENPTLNSVGYGSETLMEFLSCDGALKGLGLSQDF